MEKTYVLAALEKRFLRLIEGVSKRGIFHVLNFFVFLLSFIHSRNMPSSVTVAISSPIASITFLKRSTSSSLDGIFDGIFNLYLIRWRGLIRFTLSSRRKMKGSEYVNVLYSLLIINNSMQKQGAMKECRFRGELQ